jgi:DNA-binding MltR family transcriptional regulator
MEPQEEIDEEMLENTDNMIMHIMDYIESNEIELPTTLLALALTAVYMMKANDSPPAVKDVFLASIIQFYEEGKIRDNNEGENNEID